MNCLLREVCQNEKVECRPFESFSHGGSYFIGANFSEHVHPSYIALYILVLLVFCYRSKTGWFKNFSLTLLLLYLFLLASRGAFILLFALLALYIFEGSDYQVRLKRLGFLLIAGVLLVGLNPRIKILDERISDFFNKKNYNYTTSEQSRILIYRSSSNLIAKAPFFGYGIGDADQELLKEYIRAKYLKNSEGRYNAHNQYLQTTLQVGLFGLIFLAAPFAFLLTRRRSIYSLAMTLVMGGFLVFESMLVRYNGIIFFAVFIPILLRKKNALFRTSNLE